MVLYAVRIWSLGVIQIQAVRYLLCLRNFHVWVLDDDDFILSVRNYYIPGGLCLFFILVASCYVVFTGWFICH